MSLPDFADLGSSFHHLFSAVIAGKPTLPPAVAGTSREPLSLDAMEALLADVTGDPALLQSLNPQTLK